MMWMMPDMLPTPRYGMLPTCLLEPVAITPRVRYCRMRGASSLERESGERTLAAVPYGLSLRTVATAMPNELVLRCESRDYGPVRTGRRDCLTRGLNRRRAEKRHSLPSSLSR